MVRAAFGGDRISLQLLGIASVEHMGTRKQGENSDRSAEEAALAARLDRLGERLDQKVASKATEPASKTGQTSDASELARGLRLSSELVAGVLVGAVIGWFLDRWLGISPWGLIVFLFLGFAGGVLSIVRATESMAKRKSPDGEQ